MAVDAAFDPPARITELATAGLEEAAWVSPDGRVMFFSHLVEGAVPGGIYMTTR